MSQIFRVSLSALLVLLLSNCTPGLEDRPSDPFLEDTQEYLGRLEKLGFAGVVAISEEGKTVFARGFGLANREENTLWSPGTVSTVGSITKQFTAAAVLKLVEMGELQVEDRMSQYLPDVPSDKEAITLHHLLTHSSGVVNLQGLGDWDPIEREEFISRAMKVPLAFQPGERYEYSNAGYSLLGAVIEKVTEQSYESALSELIFEPAGLKETGYQLPGWSEEWLAQGYQGNQLWGTVVGRPMAEDGPYWALRANGGIHTTADDMLKWANALLENRVLSKGSRDKLWTPYVDESNGAGESYYGYGWAIFELPGGVKAVTHNGGNGIHFADLAIFPEARRVFFLQTNVIQSFAKSNDLLREVGFRMLGLEDYPRVPAVVEASPDHLSPWEGSYEIASGGNLEVRAHDRGLEITPHGWKAFALAHGGGDLESLSDQSEQVEGIVRAVMAGDYQPLARAYGEQVPVEEIQRTYDRRKEAFREKFGEYRGAEVLGTRSGSERNYTLVKLKFARGDVLRSYVWEKESGRMLGMTMRTLSSVVSLYPIGGDRFMTWDPEEGKSGVFSFENAGDGAVLRIGEGEMIEVATRRE
jgi:CubicO group peptidase (beta-lactamase class C family)